MNERIQELADQILPNEKEFHQGDPRKWGYFFSGEELEKFAELIIKETLLVISRTPGLYKAEEVDGMIKCFNHVEKHFGVEE